MVGCGGLTVALASSDEAWLESAGARFATFPGDGEPALAVAHGGTGPPAGVRQVFSRASAGFDAWLTGDGRVAAMPPEASIADLDSLLRYLLPRLLPDGLAFHAAVLADGERGYLCVGECGAGKSTLAALLPGQALCDEIGVVRTDGRRFVAHSTPFWTGRSGSAPLAAVMVLRHGSEHRACRIPAAAAAGRLARHLLWPSDDPAGMRRAFELLTELVAAAPVYDLAFTPTADVWDVITGTGAS